MTGWRLLGGTKLFRPKDELLAPRLHLDLPPIRALDDVDLRIDWGDGEEVRVMARGAEALSRLTWHDYPEPGRYAVAAALEISCDGFTRHRDVVPVPTPTLELPGPAVPALEVRVSTGRSPDEHWRRSLLQVSLGAARPAPLLVEVADADGRPLFEHHEAGLAACALDLLPILPHGTPCVACVRWGPLEASVPFEATLSRRFAAR